MRASTGATALALLLLIRSATAGEGPELRFPVDCTPGEDCWIYQYVDADSGPGARDYTCGFRSYEGHKGTDIALADLKAIERGVTVVAAADGRVRNIRDGVPDHLHDGPSPAGVEGRECGNGVAIQHGDGWETMYCHLRNGSVRVRPGEQVEQGRPLGEIGLSGMTQFPHLHFAVRHGEAVIDPFTGPVPPEGCGAPGAPLWSDADREATRYSPVDIYQVGAAVEPPEAAAAYAGELQAVTVPGSAPALIAWATLAAVRAGDKLTIRLVSPDGEAVAESETVLEKNQIRYFAYTGRRRTGPSWPQGEYRIEVRLVRESGDSPVRRSTDRIITVR